MIITKEEANRGYINSRAAGVAALSLYLKEQKSKIEKQNKSLIGRIKIWLNN